MERYVIKHYVELAFNGAVVIVTLLSGWHAWGTGQYLDGEQIPTLLYGFAGLMAFLFPHEFAGFSGSQGWRSTDWRFSLHIGCGDSAVFCWGSRYGIFGAMFDAAKRQRLLALPLWHYTSGDFRESI